MKTGVALLRYVKCFLIFYRKGFVFIYMLLTLTETTTYLDKMWH